MPARRLRASWDQIASLDADFIRSWGAFDGFEGKITFDGEMPDAVEARHLSAGDTFVVTYRWDSANGASRTVRSEVLLDRRPCRFGGARAYFVCPQCDGRVLRLAILPKGLLCGKCGRITWQSRRETESQRVIRRANKLALRLGLDHFADEPKRPQHMHLRTYLGIVSELETLKAEIHRRLAERLRRTRSEMTELGIIMRWGV